MKTALYLLGRLLQGHLYASVIVGSVALFAVFVKSITEAGFFGRYAVPVMAYVVATAFIGYLAHVEEKSKEAPKEPTTPAV